MGGGILDPSIKLSKDLKNRLKRRLKLSFDENKIVKSLYRPFVCKYFYSEKIMSDRLTKNHYQSFGKNLTSKNYLITTSANRQDFYVLSSKVVVDLHFTGDTNCFPLYVYNSNGESVDNITDSYLLKFREEYRDNNITKKSIFHYIYALLHSPMYRKKYKENLKKELPRIPFYENFNSWREWGQKLMDMHCNYETQKEYPLDIIECDKPHKEKGFIYLGDDTMLSGIPKEAWEYKLGTRSALEWVTNEYNEKTPKYPTIKEKFNSYRFNDYKNEAIDLLKKVCTISVETMKIIKEMPS